MISSGENPVSSEAKKSAEGDIQQYVYMFPTGPGQSSTPIKDGQTVSRGHTRSMSHGGTVASPSPASYSCSAVGAGGSAGRSALKGGRGHQRALSHGQVGQVQIIESSIKCGHSRGGSRTNFDLPPGYRDNDDAPSATARLSGKGGHSRQASRSESIYTLRRNETPSFWQRLLMIGKSSRPDSNLERGYRTVVPNHIVPPKTPKREHPNGARVNNSIRTTKYTLLSFLPRNLLEQFHRVANLYFIFIVLLNWFPLINAFGKEIAMIPVMFVLGVTAVKDLFEDRRRHASDKRINNSTCRIYKSEDERYRKTLWKDVRVGDLIHLSNNEIIPADILLLRSSDPNGLCYLDTSHLDGETNLKTRHVPRGFVEKQDVFEPSKFRSVIEVDAPSTKIYRFHGGITHPTGEKIAIGTENLLLRECVLKNTDFVEGIIVYAGHETKAMLNNGGPRYKRSTLERQMNLDVIWCVIILIVLCVIGAIGCKLWLTPLYEQSERITFLPIIYDPWLEAMYTYWTFIIILQIMIPLSLYVTLELAKILQVYHIHNDPSIEDKTMNKKVECRALNITEELGQVQYIFSDKTGTLTENKMIFKNCCINGIDYYHQVVESVKTCNGVPPILPNRELNQIIGNFHSIEKNRLHMIDDINISEDERRVEDFLTLLALCNTVIVSRTPHFDLMDASGMIDSEQTTITKTSQLTNDRYSRLAESRSITPSPPLANVPSTEIHNVNLAPSTSQNAFEPHKNVETNVATVSPENKSRSKLNTTRQNLLAIPALLFSTCRRPADGISDTKLDLEASSTNETKPIFEAESPDELALVDTAFLYNYKLLKRTPQTATLAIPGRGVVEFQVLKLLPFDSIRKTMSIIVRDPSNPNTVTLYIKGADSSILPKLTGLHDVKMINILEKTQQKINTYAKQGLRVLLMAKRVISLKEFEKWDSQHTDLELSTVDAASRDRRLRESFNKIEKELILLGATGIEDRLQEGVPETINSLIEAGIIVWVLTGDKPDTAINIAYSAKLFGPNMDILKLMTRSKDAAESSIMFYLNEIERLIKSNDFEMSDSSPVYNRHSIQLSENDFQVPTVLSIPKKARRALVVDGKTLTYILDKRSNLTKPFLRLSCYCSSVLCCRATPLQKAYIVKIVKEELKMRTLAIGDGANDVSMIQTADVGIGISGQEGMQAVMAADFAMSRFVFLKKFLLVHGHWSYDRLARMILYFFYKNAAFVFLIFWYQLYCGFSGAVMIDQMYLMLYNLLFTSLPPLVIGVYDQDCPDHSLMSEPYLYRQGRLGLVYKQHSFWITMADALYQSIAIYFIAQAAYNDTDIGMWNFGSTISTSCMYVMVFHAAIEMRSWTIIHVGSLVISVGMFYFYSLIYNSIQRGILGLPTMYNVIQENMTTAVYWLVIILTCVVALLPRLIIRVLETTYWPNDVTKYLLDRRKNTSRGEGFLVAWSRTSSTSSIFRTTRVRHKNCSLTQVG